MKNSIFIFRIFLRLKYTMKTRFFILAIMAVIIGCQPDDYEPQSPEGPNTEDITSGDYPEKDLEFHAIVPEGSLFEWQMSDKVLMFRGETALSKAITMKVKPEGFSSDDVVLYSDRAITAGKTSDKNVALLGTVSRDLMLKEESVTSYIRVDQNNVYSDGRISHSDYPMMAVSELDETDLLFFPLLGAVQVNLKGDGMTVRCIRLSGGNSEAVCGTLAVKYDEDDITTSIVSDANVGKSINLKCSSPVQLSSTHTTSFYITLPAGEYSNGFVLNIETENGVVEHIVTTSITVKRGEVSRIEEVTINSNDWGDQLNAIIAKYGFGVQNSSDITPMGTHFETFKAATDKQKDLLATATYEPRKLEAFPDWTLVAKPVNLYPFGHPSPADVVQHNISNCCFLAVLGSMAQSYPSFIENIITHNSDNTYTVKMYDPMGNQLDVCITPTFFYTADNKVGGVTGKDGVHTWASVLEKALMKYETVFNCDPIVGINPSPSLAPFVGVGTNRKFAIKKITQEDMRHVVEVLQRNGYIMTGGFRKSGYVIGTAKTVTLHEYSCLLCPDDNYLFTLRNPWGFATGGTPRGNGCMDIPWDPYLFTEGNIYLRVLSPGQAESYFIGANELVPYEKPF